MNEDIKQEIKAGIQAQKYAQKNAQKEVPVVTMPVSVIPPLENLQDTVEKNVLNSIPPAAVPPAVVPPSITPPPSRLQDAVSGILGKDGATPQQEQIEKLSEDFIQKPIRTYESDLALALAKKQTSTASIAIAESKRKEARLKKGEVVNEEIEGTSRKIIKQLSLVLLAIVFIGGGVGGGYYLYKQSAFALPPPAQKTVAITSIVTPDKQVIQTFANSLSGPVFVEKVYSLLSQESLSSNKIMELLLSEVTIDSISNKTSEPVALTPSLFFKQANIEVPDVILRSLENKWMLGAYTGETQDKTLFIALSTNYFQNVFAGMLAWESSMPEDLSTLFHFKDKIAAQNTTGTSTAAIYFNIHGNFSDKVIRNRDVREFKDTQGNLLFLYSFIDKQNLIITTTESAFGALIDRIEKQTYVR